MNCKTGILNKLDLEETREVFITDANSIKVTLPTQKPQKNKRKRKRKNTKRKVKVNTSEEGETLVITQLVKVKKVKKPKIECIIKTNICEHSENEKRKGKKLQKTDTDRVVPYCRRDRCCSAITLKCKSSLENNVKKREERQKLQISLETISPKTDSEVQKTQMSYEDISSDSFFTSDSDLDVLIKKTKDRNLSNPFNIKPPRFTSTPIPISSDSDSDWLTTTSYGSDKTVPQCKEGTDTNKERENNASFHSANTLILEVKPEAYSPTHPTSDTPENKRFSPLIPKLLELMENKNDIFTNLTPIATFEGNECSGNMETEDFNCKNIAINYGKKLSETKNYFQPRVYAEEQCFSNNTTIYDTEKKYSSNIISEKEEHLLQKAQNCEEEINTENVIGEKIEKKEIPKKPHHQTCQTKIKEEYVETDYCFNVTNVNETDISNQNEKMNMEIEAYVKKDTHLNITNKNNDLNIINSNDNDMSNRNLNQDVNIEVKKEYVKTENHLDNNDGKAIKTKVNTNNLSSNVIKAKPSALVHVKAESNYVIDLERKVV